MTQATVRVKDLALGEGRSTVRVAFTRGEDGEPLSLLLAVGYGTGDGFYRPGWGSLPVEFPGSFIRVLRDALEELEAES